jgi:hypothetical protein
MTLAGAWPGALRMQYLQQQVWQRHMCAADGSGRCVLADTTGYICPECGVYM